MFVSANLSAITDAARIGPICPFFVRAPAGERVGLAAGPRPLARYSPRSPKPAPTRPGADSSAMRRRRRRSARLAGPGPPVHEDLLPLAERQPRAALLLRRHRLVLDLSRSRPFADDLALGTECRSAHPAVAPVPAPRPSIATARAGAAPRAGAEITQPPTPPPCHGRGRPSRDRARGGEAQVLDRECRAAPHQPSSGDSHAAKHQRHDDGGSDHHGLNHLRNDTDGYR